MLMPYDFTVKEIVFTSTHFQNAQHDLFVHRRNATETSTDTSISTSVFSQDFYLGTSAFTAGQVQRETGSVSGTAGQSIFIELSAAAGDVKSPGTSTTITSGLVYIQGYVVVEEHTTTLYSG